MVLYRLRYCSDGYADLDEWVEGESGASPARFDLADSAGRPPKAIASLPDRPRRDAAPFQIATCTHCKSVGAPFVGARRLYAPLFPQSGSCSVRITSRGRQGAGEALALGAGLSTSRSSTRASAICRSSSRSTSPCLPTGLIPRPRRCAAVRRWNGRLSFQYGFRDFTSCC